MRKWMSDRLKRRKKTAEESKGEDKPAPLQPAYFDKETAAAKSTGAKESDSSPEVKAERTADRSASRRDDSYRAEPQTSKAEVSHSEDQHVHAESVPQGTSVSQPGPAAPSQGSDSSDLQRRRRRRGRGGRGRGRSAAGQPVVPTAPGVELSRPEHTDQEQLAGTRIPSQASAPGPAASNADASQRTSKGLVVLAIGLPGSGKSSWFKRHQISPLSSDLVRALLFDDPTEQRFQDLVFSNLRSMLKARLIARRPMNYVDATNLTPHERGGWIKLAKDYGYEVQAVFFDVPLETCLERNHKRQRVVSDDVMRRMSGKLKAPTFDEGFSKITVVRVKQKE
jgi:predicted kinase